MKALVSDRYGSIEVMRVAEVPEPRPGPGEVLVDVRAASVNPVDSKVRSGAFRLLRRGSFPLIVGGDVAGVVREVGRGGTQLAVGQSVYGYLSWLSKAQGTHAEQSVLPAKLLRPIPPGLDFVQAAALPCAALTAIAGLRKCGALEGRAIAVNGATGGVGHFAMQVARAGRPGKLTAVCSARNHDFARELGADEVMEYGGVDLGERRFDVLFDAFGHLTPRTALRALTPAGVYCTTLPGPAVLGQAALRAVLPGKRIAFANVDTSPGMYAELERLVASGQLRPHVARVFGLDEGVEAFRLLEAGGVRGKLVLKMA